MGDWTGTVPSFAAGEECLASKLQTMADLLTALSSGLASYTPTWTAAGTAPVLGNGTLSGGYTRTGQNGLVFFRITLVGGSTTTFGTGAWSFTIPSVPNQPSFMDFNWTGTVIDASPAAAYPCYGQFSGPNMVNPSTGSPYVSVTNLSPITFTTNDRLFIAGWYWGT